MSGSRSICILPELRGLGGPASFQARLKVGLEARGWQVGHDVQGDGCAALLVIGGPRRLLGLIHAAQRGGLRVVQRLNGMNWIHRRRWGGVRYFINAELNNLALAAVRRRADRVIYQSQFARSWWERVYGVVEKPQAVIYNGVDLKQFSPDGGETRPVDRVRLMLVEGHLSKGFEMGVVSAAAYARALAGLMGQEVELVIAGDAPEEVRRLWAGESTIQWAGVIPREEIPGLDRSAHLLFSADINAACPNSVVEALACGLPVASFSTGALPEMVPPDAGVVAPYGSDPWKLELPAVQALAEASRAVITNQERFRQGARKQAEAKFDLDDMVDRYLGVLVG